ncbi:MAG TPA: DNA circularization N-terminal domain-containing protein [Polyangiaceae bacterium]
MSAKNYPLQYPKPTGFDGLPRTSFAGLEFPAERIALHSQGRQHLHEFPHSPGAAPEKLGRGIWYITVAALFHAGLPTYDPQLWPAGMAQVRNLYETQQTATFQHPSTGTFDAFISSWKQEWNPRSRGGERVEIEFIEDQRANFLTQTDPTPGPPSLAVTQQELAAALSLVKDQLKPSTQDLNVFDAIRATVNAVQALSDTAGMYSKYAQAKALELQSLCMQADSLPSMQSPLAVGVLVNVRSIGATAAQVATQQQQASQSLGKFTVPKTMTIQDLAIRFYGDTSRETDLMALNASSIPDPMSISAGTLILYYLPTSTN